MSDEGTKSATTEPEDAGAVDPNSNELLDIFGPAVVAPVVAALFWGASPTSRILSYVGLYCGFTIIFGASLWMIARKMPQHYERGETIWSLSSGVVAATLPWIIAPEPRWSHYALGLIFAAVMASDTLYIAVRPNHRWKTVLAMTTLSYASFLALVDAWAVSAFCVVFGVHLLGGHDAVQQLVRTLRSQRAMSDELALTDPLTGLRNRRGLTRFVNDAIADPQAKRLAVAAIDIDNFKQINDRLGHHGGDAALIQLADYMLAMLGDDWLVSRSGGDEFMCVSRTAPLDECRNHLRRIPHLIFEDSVVPIQVSVGLAEGKPEESLLADSSAALRLSKQRGKHRITTVDEQLRTDLREARRLGGQLADAVQHSQIEVWAQPIVHLTGPNSGEIHSYECLARWSTPEGIRVPPSTFIPMVEDQRLTRELGEQMISRAAEFAAGLDSDVAVSVNVCASHFTGAGFAEFVLATLERNKLAPNRLTIEITETEEVPASSDSWGVARQLRTIGVGLAIDDFGTGYASLERLLRFPCSQLKLDRSIVANAAGTGLEHLLSGFSVFSEESGVEIVAEGVETSSQAELLRSLGLPLAQGYLFGRPQPIETITSTNRVYESALDEMLAEAQATDRPASSVDSVELDSVRSTSG